jgi:hypothetical protein
MVSLKYRAVEKLSNISLETEVWVGDVINVIVINSHQGKDCFGDYPMKDMRRDQLI